VRPARPRHREAVARAKVDPKEIEDV